VKKYKRTFMLLFTAVLFGGASVLQAQEKPKIVFDNSKYDFGQLKQQTTAEHIFSFKNEGVDTLRIIRVKSS